MHKFYAFLFGIAVLFAFGSRLWAWWRKRSLRRQGIYPQPGRGSVVDVERLLKAGYYIDAIACYREIFPNAGLAEAKAAVDAMQ